jgi:multidrug resistance efflux pump
MGKTPLHSFKHNTTHGASVVGARLEILPAIAEAWVSRQGTMIETARAGTLQLRSTDDDTLHEWFWPEENDGSCFAEITSRAQQEGKGLVMNRKGQAPLEKNSRQPILISYPLSVDESCHFTAAYEIEPADEAQLHRAMQQLKWGMNWLAEFGLTLLGDQLATFIKGPEREFSQLFGLIGDALQLSSYRERSDLLSAKMSQLLGCDRVVIGLLEEGRIIVSTLTDKSFAGRRTGYNQLTVSALEECVDQHKTITWPLLDDSPLQITRVHQELAEKHGCEQLLSVFLADKNDDAIGAILFERPPGHPFTQDMVGVCQSLAMVLGPMLREWRQGDLSLPAYVVKRSRKFLNKKMGSGTIGRNVGIALLCFFLLFAVFSRGDFYVSADSTLSGTTQRVIIAPFAGYVTKALKSAGDQVEKDELIAALDETELTLEQLSWSSKKNQAELEYGKAVAENLNAKAKIIKEQKRQAEIQLSLLDLQRQRTIITAPINGLLVKGDLSQSIGAPVERGQILFEIVPENEFKIILEVDEKDIAFVRKEQEGTAVLNALPQQRFEFRIVKITPVSSAANGKNTFRVEGELKSGTERLRPGMNGYGKILIDRKPLIWIWTRTILGKIRLWLWSLDL